ncbi:MAG: cysteine hydrolase [Burkholderiaceae bacterium]|nr:cysteine hydrolase [Burkholderiaceae bacterium]
MSASDKLFEIPARPGPYRFKPSQTALILIDMQRDFIEPGGFGEALGNDVSHLRVAVEPAQRLLAWARAQGMRIVHTKECHRPDLADCPPAKRERGLPSLRIGDPGPMGRILIDGEPGSDFIAELTPAPGEVVLAKPGKGAFYGTALGEMLRVWGVSHLIIAGVTTEVCVQTTMREANDRGYDCVLIEEATASYFPRFKAATIEMIVAQGGIVGWAASLESLLAAP